MTTDQSIAAIRARLDAALETIDNLAHTLTEIEERLDSREHGRSHR
ncbi:hypothetical protein [Brachybacterium sp. J153]|nr:hypothetical protein [Brachybacterium sp. J153]MEE1617315.1 hypothetical protein [Brachybacterium sp. J153]